MLTALRYLTILPLPGRALGGDLGRAAGWFPVVGLVLGALLATAAVVADHAVPSLVGSVLLVALWAGLTGGLHLDGLADALDGLGGGWSRNEALAIMRDPGVGSYGMTGIVLVLALKMAALSSFPLGLLWRAVIVTPVIGRLAPLCLVRLCPPARPEGAGHAFALSVATSGVAAAAAAATAVSLALLGVWGLLLPVSAAAAAAGFALYLRRRLGGFTGDCLGALVETSEAGTLTLLAALRHLGAL